MTPRRGSPAAVADVYECCRDTIERVARGFAGRYYLDPEEIHAQACLIFLEEYHKHDPVRGPYHQHLPQMLWQRLLDILRPEIQHHERHPRTCLTVHPVVYDPNPFDRDGLERHLSPAARTVLSLLLDTPADLAEAFQGDYSPGNESLRRCTKQYLSDTLGWERRRVRRVFREIRAALLV